MLQPGATLHNATRSKPATRSRQGKGMSSWQLRCSLRTLFDRCLLARSNPFQTLQGLFKFGLGFPSLALFLNPDSANQLGSGTSLSLNPKP